MLETVNPATGEVLATFPVHGRREVEAADQHPVNDECGAEHHIEHARDPISQQQRRQPAWAGGRSALRNLTLADLSWPHAARMSRPRGVRTGAE